MGKARTKMPVLFLAVQAFYPACNLCAKIFGWTLVLNNSVVYSVFIALFSTAMAFLTMRRKTEFSKPEKMLLSIALPAGLLNGLMLLADGSTAAVLINAVCCIVMYSRDRRLKRMRIFTGILSAVLIFAMIMLIPVNLMFGGIGVSTVLKSIPSPDGRHMAKVVDVDQGALGGDTVVRVQKNSGFFQMIGGICEFEKTVYIGEWGIGDILNPEWMDGDSLLIDGEIYAL